MTLRLMLEGYEFFDPDQPIEEYYGCLPHWRQEGVLYFVTFRTADSLLTRPTYTRSALARVVRVLAK